MKTWTQRSRKERESIERLDAEKRKLVVELKNRPCDDCKQEYPSEAMDFDHVPGRGGKLGTVASRPTLQAIAAEARKCDVVCSNCHRVRTRKRHYSTKMVKRERESYLDGLVEAIQREQDALREMRG